MLIVRCFPSAEILLAMIHERSLHVVGRHAVSHVVGRHAVSHVVGRHAVSHVVGRHVVSHVVGRHAVSHAVRHAVSLFFLGSVSLFRQFVLL